jgi:hypothetical protein
VLKAPGGKVGQDSNRFTARDILIPAREAF